MFKSYLLRNKGSLISYHFQLPYYKESYELYIFSKSMFLNRACQWLTDFLSYQDYNTPRCRQNILCVESLKSLVVMTVYVEPAQFSENLSDMYDCSLMAGFL